MDEPTIIYNKHYILTDDRNRIIDGWSDGPHPERDTAGAICITEQGSYQFRLFPDQDYPLLFDLAYSIPLYKYENGKVQNRTEEELRADREAAEQAQREEQARADAERAKEEALAEAQAVLVTAQINTLSVDDATALRWKMLYPQWAVDILYEKDVKVQYQDRLFKCLQQNTSQVGWEPPNVPALWTEINETHSGDVNDPIPYNNNMALENGKYYTQDGVKYRCTRDTGNPVYNPLAELVGLYVEVVED